MGEVRGQDGEEAGGGGGEGGPYGLEAERHCTGQPRWWVSRVQGDVRLLPLRMTMSRAPTKSARTTSASWRPASTEMMSELGFVYFLVRAASKNTVKVWPVSQRMHSGQLYSYLECDLVRRRGGLLDARNGTAEQLLRMRLQVQHLVGRDAAQEALQAPLVWPVQEELLPEALGELCVVFIVLRRRSAPSAPCGEGGREGGRVRTRKSVS